MILVSLINTNTGLRKGLGYLQQAKNNLTCRRKKRVIFTEGVPLSYAWYGTFCNSNGKDKLNG